MSSKLLTLVSVWSISDELFIYSINLGVIASASKAVATWPGLASDHMRRHVADTNSQMSLSQDDFHVG